MNTPAEQEALEKLNQAMVTVVVVHKPDNMSTSKVVSLPMVRKWAQVIIDEFQQRRNREGKDVPTRDDFIIVEVPHGALDKPRVSTLD